MCIFGYTLSDKKAIVVNEPRVLIQQVEKGSPAEKAGINLKLGRNKLLELIRFVGEKLT